MTGGIAISLILQGSTGVGYDATRIAGSLRLRQYRCDRIEGVSRRGCRDGDNDRTWPFRIRFFRRMVVEMDAGDTDTDTDEEAYGLAPFPFVFGLPLG